MPKKPAATAALDIRDVLPRGRNGEGVIDGADIIVDRTHATDVYQIHITIDGKKYVAERCILQTEKWTPKKGELVRFFRQPEGVDDTYLHAELLEA